MKSLPLLRNLGKRSVKNWGFLDPIISIEMILYSNILPNYCIITLCVTRNPLINAAVFVSTVSSVTAGELRRVAVQITLLEPPEIAPDSAILAYFSSIPNNSPYLSVLHWRHVRKNNDFSDGVSDAILNDWRRNTQLKYVEQVIEGWLFKLSQSTKTKTGMYV